ncbi:hypothetical protein NCCP2222_00360 [Sporosarcina sp. NCCP-2222]|uniref:hypothetical protein n=1 Tax=Sporosarcina sp. NCCP-2222 TaxID=2935073 RepID=UPI00208CD4C3|nr:hypothetical protein [Sporosarcina sp. NCCP-2222]GKV54089.1 hypothetical protein NCCP2222_00360 [Sporosarcina sp. NCCP-2222]
MKKRLVMGAVVAFVLCFGFIYWFYFSSPSSFPTDQEVTERINKAFPGAVVSTVLDKLPADERHLVIPAEDDYGLSYWVWEHREWKIAEVDGGGRPKIWKVNVKDPSSYRIVWNIRPDQQAQSVSFYAVQHRNYSWGDEVGRYVPRIQMEKEVLLSSSQYGMIAFPNEWLSYLESEQQAKTSPIHGSMLTSMYMDPSLQFGWNLYDESKNELNGTWGRRSGESYSYEQENIEFLLSIYKSELE